MHGNLEVFAQYQSSPVSKPVLCFKESEPHFPLTEMIIDFS